MEQTTELRLAWRQEFATALLDELEYHKACEVPGEIINRRCNDSIFIAEYAFNMRNLEFSLMGYVVKRKLKRRGLQVVIQYLEMIEDCFTNCKMCLN